MKLITEEIETAKVLIEEKDGKKNMFIEGIFLQGNLKNINGRFYPSPDTGRTVINFLSAQLTRLSFCRGVGPSC